MDNAIEIFTLITGILFIILEIRQSNYMWGVQILTGIASVVLFCRQGLYASSALNVYYVVTAVWGFISWRRDSDSIAGDAQQIHLRKISLKVLAVSALLQAVGTAALICVLRALGDPMSSLDAAITVMSLIATWWLIRSYKEQWLLWIVADLMYVVMCGCQGLYWMAALYLFYTLSAAYGFVHWRKRGKYVEESGL